MVASPFPLRRLRCALLFLGLALALAKLSAGDWPCWRGPSHTGISEEANWQLKWPADGPRVAWKAKVGLGMSSFVVAGGRAYSLGHADGKDTLYCFEAATGRPVWKHSHTSELGDKFFDGGTTGTPTYDSGQIFFLDRWGLAFCLNATNGTVIWERNVQEDAGARIPDWGFGGSPLVLSNRVFLNVGEAGLALNRATGDIVWKSGPKSAGYSSVLPLPGKAPVQGLVSSGSAYSAVNLLDGSVRWSIRWVTQYGVNAADPVVDGDRVFLSTGYGKGGALYRMGGAEPELVWKGRTLRTQMNPAVLWRGHLYGVDGDTTEKASLKCVEFETGTEKWAVPDFGNGGLVVAGGHLLALNGTGELVVAPAEPSGFHPVSRAQVLGGKTWTAPVLSEGRIFCRNTLGFVVCLDVSKP
ncbi:MAG: PQQ-binding-like beta-propeller repeat protein [Verrucomicrobiota bacterium]